jgi:hypothetical protein
MGLMDRSSGRSVCLLQLLMATERGEGKQSGLYEWWYFVKLAVRASGGEQILGRYMNS